MTRPLSWSNGENQFLIENHKKMKRNEIAEHLCRTKRQVYQQISSLRAAGLIPPLPNRERKRQVKPEIVGYEVPLSSAQIALITLHYKSVPRSKLAKLVGISKLELNYVLINKGLDTSQ